MKPIGYMAKRVVTKPDWLKTNKVDDILSVSGCVSEDFADWINYWKHNGYWFFDSPDVIVSLADEHDLDLSQARWFYFEAYEKEFDEDSGEWRNFDPEASFATCIVVPENMKLMGYDIITFSCGTSAECSPLSCNHVAKEVKVNRHCLLDSFEAAMSFVDTKAYLGGEPGPYRIFAVYEVPAPKLKLTEQAGGANALPRAAHP